MYGPQGAPGIEGTGSEQRIMPIPMLSVEGGVGGGVGYGPPISSERWGRIGGGAGEFGGGSSVNRQQIKTLLGRQWACFRTHCVFSGVVSSSLMAEER